MIGQQLHPEALKAIASVKFERAYELNKAVYAVEYSAVHPPEGLSEEAKQQRSALLTIQAKILGADRDRAMDEAMDCWREFRTWEGRT